MIRVNLDVPESCYSCPFCDYEEGYCLADKKERNVSEYSNRLLEKKKPDWCPCVEVKEEFLPLHKHIVSIWVDKKSIVYNDEG